MVYNKKYKLFLSHMWKNEENSDYYRLENLLKKANGFLWDNYSVPEHDPLGCKTYNELSSKLYERISYVDCFLIISGMYVKYSKWIKKELDIAISLKKPIIGLEPWGQERLPLDVQQAAKEMVKWNTEKIVNAIRKWSL